jgi:hypothetical protein
MRKEQDDDAADIESAAQGRTEGGSADAYIGNRRRGRGAGKAAGFVASSAARERGGRGGARWGRRTRPRRQAGTICCGAARLVLALVLDLETRCATLVGRGCMEWSERAERLPGGPSLSVGCLSWPLPDKTWRKRLDFDLVQVQGPK